MGGLFKTIPKSLPPKTPDDYKSNLQKTIKEVVGRWFIDKINAKLPPIKRSRLRKKVANKRRKSRKIL